MALSALQSSCRWTFQLASRFSGRAVARTLVNHAALRDIPPIREKEGIVKPQDFLKAIGRSCETKVKVEDWNDLWTSDRNKFKEMGVDVRDRRYIMWCMKRYRDGQPVASFAYELKPKTTVRGWGPSVQNGKRIRSRRIKTVNEKVQDRRLAKIKYKRIRRDEKLKKACVVK